tara:strand:- start:83 stop:319 length:237 start_codon:yes stop_codon:yes gene_type:complete
MSEDKKLKLVLDDKEYKFEIEDLSQEGQAQYTRANQLAGELMRLDQQSNELRFLANNYIRFVTDELDKDKSVDDKSKK